MAKKKTIRKTTIKKKPMSERRAIEGRMVVYLDPDVARWTRVAAATEATSIRRYVQRALVAEIRKNPPPGYKVAK